VVDGVCWYRENGAGWEIGVVNGDAGGDEAGETEGGSRVNAEGFFDDGVETNFSSKEALLAKDSG